MFKKSIWLHIMAAPFALKTVTTNTMHMSAVALFSTQNITFIWSVPDLCLKLQRTPCMSGPPLVLYVSYRISKIWWSLSDIYSIRRSSNRRRSGRCPAPDGPVEMTQTHRSRLHVFSSASARYILQGTMFEMQHPWTHVYFLSLKSLQKSTIGILHWKYNREYFSGDCYRKFGRCYYMCVLPPVQSATKHTYV